MIRTKHTPLLAAAVAAAALALPGAASAAPGNGHAKVAAGKSGTAPVAERRAPKKPKKKHH